MSNESTENQKASLVKPLLLAVGTVGLLVVLSLVFHDYFKQPQTREKPAVATKTSQPAHTPAKAVSAVGALYEAYLPLKTATYNAVGDNPNVEPAAVQILRASDIYFTKSFYNTLLKQYMSEYQSTGKVASDGVACIAATSAAHSETLVSSTKDSATVGVTMNLPDASTKAFQATVDRNTLKVSNISCK